MIEQRPQDLYFNIDPTDPDFNFKLADYQKQVQFKTNNFERRIRDLEAKEEQDLSGYLTLDDLRQYKFNLNGFAGFANPSAMIGLVTVNGVLSTGMRSDAAPALDQNIAPTWTNTHRWAAANRTEYRDAALYINSDNDGYLDFHADTAVRINSAWVGLNSTPNTNTNWSANGSIPSLIEMGSNIAGYQFALATWITQGGLFFYCHVRDTNDRYRNNFFGGANWYPMYIGNYASSLELSVGPSGNNDIWNFGTNTTLRNIIDTTFGFNINVNAGDFNTIIYGTSSTAVFFVDAGQNCVGIGTTTPLLNVGSAAGDFYTSAATVGMHIKGGTNSGDIAYLILEGTGTGANGASIGGARFVMADVSGIGQIKYQDYGIYFSHLNADTTESLTQLILSEIGSTVLIYPTSAEEWGFYSNALNGEIAGTVKQVTDMLVLHNTVNAADMDGTGVGILFFLSYNNAIPGPVGAGHISCYCEQDMTSTASTKNTRLAFATSLNGTLANKLLLTSSGILYLNNNQDNPLYLLISNTNNHANAYAQIRLNGYGSSAALITATPPLNATYSDKVVFESADNTGLVITQTGNSPIDFYTNSTLRGQCSGAGVWQFGLPATNYAQIDADGDLSFTGTARIDWTKKTAASVTITVGGTDASSVVANLQTENDGNIFHLDEAAAAPAIDFYVEFTSITAFNWVHIRGIYEGSATHALGILLYKWGSAAWEHKNCMQNGKYDSTAGQQCIDNYSFFVPVDTDYIGTGGDAGKVRVRFVHPMGGNNSHDLYIDVVALYQ